jgi:hypothetical protein
MRRTEHTMAKPIKPTPTLRGKDAEQFIARVEKNASRDHSQSFARARAVFDRFQAHGTTASHATVQTRPR